MCASTGDRHCPTPTPPHPHPNPYDNTSATQERHSIKYTSKSHPTPSHKKWRNAYRFPASRIHTCNMYVCQFLRCLFILQYFILKSKILKLPWLLVPKGPGPKGLSGGDWQWNGMPKLWLWLQGFFGQLRTLGCYGSVVLYKILASIARSRSSFCSDFRDWSTLNMWFQQKDTKGRFCPF